MKKIFTTVIFSVLTTANLVFARQAIFSGEDYSINVNYNEKAFPGDAVFVRMKITQTSSGTKKAKVTKNDISQSTANLELIVEGKSSRYADFYAVSKATKTSKTMLAGVPLSSWWTKDTKCSLRITYTILGETKEFSLPFILEHKEFVSETLELDGANTSIKTDTSKARMDQISRLNAILETINPQNVYCQNAFKAPVESTRRTSFFADRRVYQYNTGNSSTSLHLGIDYGVPAGTEVRAASDGKVVMAENRISTGWSVVIEHLPGLYTLYYHMSELKVKVGDSVKQGHLIGLSGATGLATGPHLHWETRLNLEAVSPDFFTSDFTFSGEQN